MKDLFHRFANHFGLEVIRTHTADALRGSAQEAHALFDEILRIYSAEPSRAQLKQDVFALLETGFKRGGFFVEFGATDGQELSNTYLLEKAFDWDGILAEPATVWHADLRKNRNSRIDTRCVWHTSDEKLRFNMTPVSHLSTIDCFSESDMHAASRADGLRYAVESVSLLDLLRDNDAPRDIDYLSIDTEGSEYAILSTFDFSKYQFKVITIEHNFTAAREKLHRLLTNNGYERKFEHLSKWDDWYICS